MQTPHRIILSITSWATKKCNSNKVMWGWEMLPKYSWSSHKQSMPSNSLHLMCMNNSSSSQPNTLENWNPSDKSRIKVNIKEWILPMLVWRDEKIFENAHISHLHKPNKIEREWELKENETKLKHLFGFKIPYSSLVPRGLFRQCIVVSEHG